MTSDTPVRGDQEQRQGGGSESAPKGMSVSLKTIRSLSGITDSMEQLSDQLPEGFTLSYAEVDGKVDDQAVQATFEDGEWQFSLEPAGEKSEQEGGESSEQDQEQEQDQDQNQMQDA